MVGIPGAVSTASDAQAKLDTDDTTKLDATHDVQDAPTEAVVRPKVSVDVMSGNVTIPVSAVQQMPGYMAIITTDEGQLIVPGVGFADGNLPSNLPAGSAPSEVVVTAAYARSQSLI